MDEITFNHLDTLDDVKKRFTIFVLTKCNGNKTHAAKSMGVSLRALQRFCCLNKIIIPGDVYESRIEHGQPQTQEEARNKKALPAYKHKVWNPDP